MTDTQLPGPHNRGLCDVIVGLDFGTSCTKVVLRTPDIADRAFAVPFGSKGHRSSQHLCPSLFWLDARGVADLGNHRAATVLADLKNHMVRDEPFNPAAACTPTKVEPMTAAVAYLALVLRLTRAWFLREHADAYAGYELDWQINLGLPSADFDDQALCRRYLDLLTAAWWLSLGSDDINLSRAQEAQDLCVLDNEVPGLQGELEYGQGEYVGLNLVPEVAAEVAGYARSDLRDAGLHMLVDAGAGTLDLCGFILHADQGQDRYELLTGDVRPLGALALLRSRYQAACPSSRSLWRKHLDDGDAVTPIPQHDALLAGDEAFVQDCRRCLHSTLHALKCHRDPNSARWKTKLPVFLGGGAGNMVAYSEALKLVSEYMQHNFADSGGLEVRRLSKPEKLEGSVHPRVYHRMGVAWGLSYPECDLGDMRRPQDIESIDKRPKQDPMDRFVSKDAV